MAGGKVMNSVLKELIQKSGKSAYQVSHETGIPYTTISELLNDKIDINRCAAETVCRLSVFYNCDMNELLNHFELLENVEGVYRHIRYKWKKSGEKKVALHIWDKGKEIILDEGEYSQVRFFNGYHEMTLLSIDIYLEEKELQEALNETVFSHA